MKYIKIGFDFFSKRMILNLLLVLQIAISIIAVNIVFARGEALRYDINLFEKVSDPNTLCIMPPISDSDFIDLSEIHGNYEIGKSDLYSMLSERFFSINITAYSDCLMENIRIPLSKGSWFAKPITENGITYYPVVICKEYQDLGYMDKLSLPNGDYDVNIYIAGILDSTQKYLYLNYFSNRALCGDLLKSPFDYGEALRYSSMRMFTVASNVPESFGKKQATERTKFIFFESDLSEEDLKYNIDVLSDQGFVYSIDSLLDNSYDDYKETIRTFLPFCIIIYIIALTGLVSFVALNILQNTYFFAVLYLCGCRWKNCRNICLAYIGIISAISLIVSFFLFTYLKAAGTFDMMELYFTIKNIWLTASVVALMFVIAVAVPFVMMKRFSVSEFIRKYEK